MMGSLDLDGYAGHLVRRAEQVHTSLWSRFVPETKTSRQFAVLNALRSDGCASAAAASPDAARRDDGCGRGSGPRHAGSAQDELRLEHDAAVLVVVLRVRRLHLLQQELG